MSIIQLGSKLDPRDSLKGVEKFLAAATAVGVDVANAMPDVVAAVELARMVDARSSEQPVDIGTLQTQLADQVLNGTLDLDKALDQISEADRINARGSAGAVLLERIAKSAARRAWQVFAAYGPRLLEVLEPANSQIIDEVSQLAPQLLDVTSDRDALRRHLAEPWQTLTEAFERWQRLHQLANAVRNGGLDNTSRTRRPVDFAPHELAFREYLRTTEFRQRDFGHPGVWLYHAAQVGKPGVLTLAEGVRLAARDEAIAADARRNPKDRGRPPELRDIYGDREAVVGALDDISRRNEIDRSLSR